MILIFIYALVTKHLKERRKLDLNNSDYFKNYIQYIMPRVQLDIGVLRIRVRNKKFENERERSFSNFEDSQRLNRLSTITMITITRA